MALGKPDEPRKKWLTEFQENLRYNPTAHRAWGMLVRAGLETATLRALWTYAHPPASHVEKAHRRVRRVSRQMKALIRAGKIEGDRRNAGDPRSDLFYDRYWSKFFDFMRSEMPFEDHGVTVTDWARSLVVTGKQLSGGLSQFRKMLVSLGPRGPVSSRMLWLFILQCYAANAGVRLGVKRLAALADCSYVRRALDDSLERTLARYLASLPRTFQANCRRDLSKLPTPPLLPPESR